VRLSFHNLKTNPKDNLLKLLLALLLVISVAALFTHVIEHRPFKIALAFILAYLTLPSVLNNKNQLFQNVLALIITGIFSLFQYYFELKNSSNYRKWEQAKALFATGYILESQKEYASLYPQLKGDIEFLKSYNEVLVGHNNANKKIFLLKEILKRYTNNLTYLKMANAYEEIDRRKEAELAFLKALYMVPNRFIPKEALFNFYIKNKQYEKARYWRKVILTMPVKIPSERVETIKQTVKNLNNY
jgi:O-antigen polymerase